MTHVMAKGANIPLTATAVRAVLRWSATPGAPDVDVSALLVAADGKVRSDADFVFYNQPRHPSGLVRHLPKQQAGTGDEVSDTVEIDLGRLTEDVDRVVLAGSSEEGSFPSVPRLRVLVFDASAGEGAEPLAEFPVTDSGDVTALVAGEFYRRDGGWKFRAIGQGYATGLSGLATDYGIAVEDGEEVADALPPVGGPPAPEPAELPEEPDIYTLAPAAPPAAPVPPPPSTPPTVGTPAAPAPAGYGYPQPAAAQAGGYGYPPPQQQPQQPTGGYGYPQQQPGYGYPQQQPAPGYGYPQQQPAPQPQPPAPAPQPTGAPGFALPPQGPQFQPR
ncbi:TerD family protein [Kitasatospora sp. DSM 101779]|uniref:TerD family protein n=1 Tax=Kitasatospora sp. DSM 101779 TaxID=2853165 RepID=UPI0021D88F70|nr:TerD family protein [Kitasatospora sp. DSM 101779]MCU7824961.1 TerD family protein [Kitasatospora sp. DSM 101779]